METGWAIFLLALGVAAICFGVGRDIWVPWAVIVCITSAVGFFTGQMRFPRKLMTALPTDSGEFRLLPRRTRREQFWTFAIPLGAAAIASTVIVAHQFVLSHGLSSEEQWMAFIGVAAWLGLIVHSIRGAIAGRKFGQPRVIISTDQPRLDQSFQMRVEAESAEPVQGVECEATLRCMEHALLHLGRYTHHAVRPKSQRLIQLGTGVDISPDKPFRATSEVLLDSTQHLPTGKSGITMYPYYHWEVEVKFSGRTNVGEIFPLTVANRPTPDDLDRTG